MRLSTAALVEYTGSEASVDLLSGWLTRTSSQPAVSVVHLPRGAGRGRSALDKQACPRGAADSVCWGFRVLAAHRRLQS
jgi:hypothetical protein